MTKTFCDLCGKAIKTELFVYYFREAGYTPDPHEELDTCKDCKQRIIDFIEDNIKIGLK